MIAWGGVLDCYLSPMEIIQKRIIKTMFHRPIRYPTAQLFLESKLFNIRKLNIMQSLKYIHKKPTDFYQSFGNRVSERLQNFFIIPTRRKRSTQRHSLFVAPKAFNRLPNESKNIKNHLTFTRAVKAWLHATDVAEFYF
jgi:hypothetical protein